MGPGDQIIWSYVSNLHCSKSKLSYLDDREEQKQVDRQLFRNGNLILRYCNFKDFLGQIVISSPLTLILKLLITNFKGPQQ